MGKSRRNRGGGAHRRDPISKPVKPPSDPELARLRESKVLPIVKQLQSADPKARSTAAAAVANIIQTTNVRKLLLREHIVHILLTQTLTDAALESRAAGWAILQLLAQEEDADFCVHLFRLDALTAVDHACEEITRSFTSVDHPFSKLPRAEQDFRLRIASCLVSLLTLMAEAQDDILDSICSGNHVVPMVQAIILHSDQLAQEPGTKLLRDTLHCLMVLSEDNPAIAEAFLAPENQSCAEKLMQLKDDSVQGYSVLACGVLHNIFATVQTSKNLASRDIGADDSIVVTPLTKVIASVTPDQPVVNGGSEAGDLFDQQLLALEVLADIGTTLSSPGPQGPKGTGPAKHTKRSKPEAKQEDGDENMADGDEGEDEEDEDVAGDEAGSGTNPASDDDDEMDEDEMQADIDLVTGPDDAADDKTSIDDVPVLKALLHTALPVFLRIASLSASSEHAMRLQNHSLAALNNIAWSISVFDFDQPANEGIRQAWTPLAITIWERVITPILASDTADIALATQITSLAWAVARALGDRTPLQPGECDKFIALYQATRPSSAGGGGADGSKQHAQNGTAQADHGDDEHDDPFQTLGVKCIGLLGQLAYDPTLNAKVGIFLMTVIAGLAETTPTADAVEALNQVFDIYADEKAPCEGTFWEHNFWNHLDQARPKLRTAMKAVDRKKHEELRTRTEEANMNLTRFLDYKKKHRPQSAS